MTNKTDYTSLIETIRCKMLKLFSVLILLTFIQLKVATAQEFGVSDLAAASQNPIASMISIPFQFNFNFNIGDYNRTQTVINIEPVIPYQMTKKWEIVNRIIIPVMAQPDVNSESGSTGGIGNTNYTAFFVPPSIKKTAIGFGPSFIIPTRTNEALGAPDFGIGPSFVIFSVHNKWTFGFVAAQNWSWLNNKNEGTTDNKQNLSSFFAQYFVAYNIKNGWAVGSSPTLTANFNAADSEQWIVPFGAYISKVHKFGKQATKFSLAGYGNAVKPTVGPIWQLQFAFTLLFP